jgi:hypothetical protein
MKATVHETSERVVDKQELIDPAQEMRDGIRKDLLVTEEIAESSAPWGDSL